MRQIIKTKDIQVYFGKKYSMSFKMLTNMKKDLGKSKHQPITIKEFCKYYNVDEESISQSILENDNKEKEESRPREEQQIETKQMTSVTNKVDQTYKFAKRTH
ncbi:hypothetical protein [Flavobacterium sp.]|uniref:hypothetical protein n=1 Tax=Flavobacterium sp. TaxID=239 RepID=UPI0025C1F846|nr:hypothetical protein [Flavobacterium sp.]